MWIKCKIPLKAGITLKRLSFAGKVGDDQVCMGRGISLLMYFAGVKKIGGAKF